MYLRQPQLSPVMRMGRALRHGSFGDVSDEASDPDVLAAIHNCPAGQTWDDPNQVCMATIPSATTPPTTTPALNAASAVPSTGPVSWLPTSVQQFIDTSTPSGGSPTTTLLLLGAAAAGAWYLFGRKKKG